MRKYIKKLGIVACMVVCIGGVCTGCQANTENKKNTEQQSTVEEQGIESSEVIEKEIELDAGSDEKIEFSIEGAAKEEDTQSGSND